MTKEEIKLRLENLMRQIVPVEVFDSQLSLKDDLGIDSLALVNVLVQLEEAFNITIDISDLSPEKLKTIGDLYTLVEKYISNNEE